MTEFKALQLEDKDIFDKYLKAYKYGTYEYAFSTLYMWRHMCKPEYCILQDSLIVRKDEKNKGRYFMPPIGIEDHRIKNVIDELIKIQNSRPGIDHLLSDVEEDFLAALINIYGDKVKYVEDENNFDYIYDTSELINLTGKKYHGKKNHYNSFIKSYSYTIKDIKEDGVGEECISMARKWLEGKENVNEELLYEQKAIEDIITHVEELNLEGMVVIADDNVVGFTLGEKLREDLAVIHIEKGNNDYSGIYAFINKVFLEQYFSDVKYVNRQEDAGIKGLRKAKKSYCPIKLEKKFIVDIEG
ncbi:DUF2156 domain-containing protein [Clostridium thermarum]|uniref:DUF2156 domain-containing protein n=1 Tax=Clostridium thermarum TaxID=1716543 RepID=UPI0013D1DB4E|nr:phosphatidylglycerol lysyltransferase domain-containing protein [Clostridium thermarum]